MTLFDEIEDALFNAANVDVMSSHKATVAALEKLRDGFCDKVVKDAIQSVLDEA